MHQVFRVASITACLMFFAKTVHALEEYDLRTLVVGCAKALNLRDANSMVSGSIDNCDPNENCEFSVSFGNDAVANVILEFDLRSGQPEQGSRCQASVGGVAGVNEATAIGYFRARHYDATESTVGDGFFKALNCYEWGGQTEVIWQKTSEENFHYYIYKYDQQTQECGG